MLMRDEGVDADLVRFALGHRPGSRRLERVYYARRPDDIKTTLGFPAPSP